MRPRYGKRKSMENVNAQEMNLISVPVLSSTKFQSSTDLNQMSSALILRTTVADRIKHLQSAQTIMKQEYQHCIRSLEKQIQRKEAKNSKLRAEISYLHQKTRQMSGDINAIIEYTSRNMLMSKSKKTHLKHSKNRHLIFDNLHKNSTKLLRLVKPGLII